VLLLVMIICVSLHSANASLTIRMHVLFTDNAWANVQVDEHPAKIRWNLENKGEWSKLINSATNLQVGKIIKSRMFHLSISTCTVFFLSFALQVGSITFLFAFDDHHLPRICYQTLTFYSNVRLFLTRRTRSSTASICRAYSRPSATR
jgi:hypothetical protein